MRAEEKIIFNEIRKGNKQVFEALFAEYYESMVLFAQSFLFDQQQCEDLVQDFFVHIWEKASNIEIKTSLKAYCYAAIRNKCLNHIQSLQVQDKHNTLYVDAILQSGDDIEYFDVQLIDTVRESIEELPEQMRKVFTMKLLENKKREEIAEELGISLNTVKTHLSRSKSKLREILKNKTHLTFLL